MKISIIGSGVVGTIIGKGFKKLGHEVIFYDISKERIKQLKKEGFDTTTDINYTINNSDVSFISVPTPTIDERIDLSCIRFATENIAKSLRNKDRYHLVVIKSTVVPTTTEKFVKPILERLSGKKCGEDFGLCTNPEFLTEIHRSWSNDPSLARDFFTEDRIVIGEFDKKSGNILETLYKPLNIPIFRMNLKSAEMIKYASNCCLASRISYWNEIFLICRKLGIDAQKISDIVAMDGRIGKYGSVITRKGYRGKCLPKDVKAFIAFAEKFHNPILLKAVDKVNEKIWEMYKNGSI